MLITYLNRHPPYTFCNYSPYRPLTMVPLPPTHKKRETKNKKPTTRNHKPATTTKKKTPASAGAINI